MAISDTITSMYENVGEVYDTLTNVEVNNGKNLFNAEAGQVGYVKNDGTIGNDSSNYASDYIYLGQNTDFTISANQSMTNIGIAYFDNSKAIILPREDNSNKQTVSKNTGNAYYVRFWVQKSGATMSASEVKETYQIMLNKGTTALPYQPYTQTPTYKNIENIPSTIRKSYLNIMNNGYQDIWDSWDKVNGSGTSVSLNNTEEAPMSLTYKGNTSQNGTPTPSSPIPVQVVSGDNSIEVCGKNLLNTSLMKEFTPNSTTWYSLDGIDGFYNATQIAKSNLYYNIISGQTYTLSVYSTKNLSTSANNPIQLVNESGNVISSIAKNTTSITFTASTSGRAYPRMSVNSASTLTQCLLQLEKGSTATTYEPYQGASYPINLGANLFDMITAFDNMRATASGILYVQRDNYILLNGTSTGYNGPYTKGGYASTEKLLEMKANHTYRFLANVEHNINEIPMRMYAGTTSHNVINTPAMSNGIFYVDYTPTTDTTFNQLSLVGSTASGQVHDNTKVQIAIYDITNVKTNVFYPYFTPIELCKIGTYQDKIDKSTGKNLFDYNDFKTKITTATITGAENNFKLERISTSTINYNLDLPSGVAYTFSGKWSTTYGNGALSIYYDDNTRAGFLVSNYSSSSANGTISLTTDATKKISYLKIELYNNCNFTLQDFIVNEGSTATEYEPYGTGWYLKKEIGKVVLNGTEYWTKTNDTVASVFTTPLTQQIGSTMPGQIISNYFKAQYKNVDGAIYCSNKTNIALVRDNTYTLESFKTWLASNNTIVYYQLDIPTYTKIEGTLISQLEEAKKSYESQTNITQTNNDLPFELDVVALGVM